MVLRIKSLVGLRIKQFSYAAFIVATGIFGLSPTGIAATATSNFQVTATVVATCQIAATNLAFGSYTGVQTDITSTITATCTNTTPYTIGLSAGAATNATVTTRGMTGPTGAVLNYAMFKDSARTTNWGTTSTDTVSGTGNGAAQPISVYGRITAGQLVAPGTYTDTILATITF